MDNENTDLAVARPQSFTFNLDFGDGDVQGAEERFDPEHGVGGDRPLDDASVGKRDFGGTGGIRAGSDGRGEAQRKEKRLGNRFHGEKCRGNGYGSSSSEARVRKTAAVQV